MRRVVLAILSAVTVGLMLAMPVSAGKSTVVTVSDTIEDLGMYNVFMVVGPTNSPVIPNPTWEGNAPVVDATYLDMVSISIGMVRGKYVFSMELAGDVSQAGNGLPSGSRFATWMWWIENGPWDPMSPTIPKTYYQVALEFDESGYSAGIYDVRNAWIFTPVPYTIDGATFKIEVPEKLLGGVESFWWSSATALAKENVYAWPWFTDLVDPGADQGQVGYDFPWPPV